MAHRWTWILFAQLVACGPSGSGGAPPDDVGVEADVTTDSEIGVEDTAPDTAMDTSLPPDFTCSTDGWCWVNPLPQGNMLWGGWAAAADDAWFVGFAGTLVHWDGTTAKVASANPAYRLVDVWGSSAHDVWAVGDAGTTLHFDGSGWSEVSSGTFENLQAVWGSSANDVWAGGGSGTLLHFSDGDWKEQPVVAGAEKAEWSSMWGSSATDVWAASIYGGFVAHWNGTTWSRVVDDALKTGVSRIGGTSAKDVWMLLGGGGVVRYDGTSFKPVGSPIGARDLRVVGKDDAWVASDDTLFHWEGTYWVEKAKIAEDARYGYMHLVARSASDMWLLPGYGRIDHWDGSSLKTIVGQDVVPNGRMSGASATDAWMTTSKGARHWDGITWKSVAVMPDDPPVDVYQADATHVFMVGDHGTLARLEGSTWTLEAPSSYRQMAGIAGTSANDVWAVGSGHVAHWDGAKWSDEDFAGSLRRVWGRAPNDYWTAGINPVDELNHFWHWDGTSWKDVASTEKWTYVTGFWGTAADDVWASSWKGVFHWNGVAWNLEKVAQLNGIWGSAPDDIWAMGMNLGLILHYDGAAWTTSRSGTLNLMSSVWGSGAHDVWATGTGGTILHRTK